MEQPEELNRLKDRFVGEWDLDMTIRMPDGSALTGRGTATVREVSRGYGIESVLAYTFGDMPYEETDLWSYDRWGETIHMFGVGSDGSVHDHTGRWKDADTLELHWRGAREGGEAEETITATWESADTVRIRSESTSGGKPGPAMNSVGRKRKG
ncbi:MAG TPA: hypothetical protein PLG75_02675 [Methanoculleus sp.]|nr:hypothetical protein [Methanoculleus sp.]